MKKKILVFALAFMFLAVLAAPLASIVQAKKVTETDMGDYTEYIGTLAHANFVVRIPDEWNGGLVVGCHGYMGSGWFPDAQFVMDNLPSPPDGGVSLPDALVGMGFAYAASSYGEGGWPIKEAMIRTHQLTEYVIDNFGVTGEVFVIGHSMGGAIALLLGEKYPELYDGVLDISGMRDIVLGYADSVSVIAEIEAQIAFLQESGQWDLLPQAVKDEILFWLALMNLMKADIEAQYGGSYDDKPQHYERLNPVDNAEISIPMISVTGEDDGLSTNQAYTFEDAVAEAGCSEYYQLYMVPGGDHGNRATIDAALLHFEELIDYPNNWP